MRESSDLSAQKLEHQRGSIIITALISMIIIVAITTRITLHAGAIARATHTTLHGYTSHNEIRARFSSVPVSSSRECVTQRVTDSSSLLQAWHVCHLIGAPFKSEPSGIITSERFDYAPIISSATPCPSRKMATAKRAFTAPHAPFDCDLSGSRPAKTIITENIRASNLQITPSNSAPYSVLASPGELEVAGLLTLSGDTLIVSGGDIKIARIHNSSAGVIQVTILSAHGTIQVSELGPQVSILSIGRSAIAVPASLYGSNYPLPNRRLQFIAGIAPTLGG